jgi:hypothetical protein
VLVRDMLEEIGVCDVVGMDIAFIVVGGVIEPLDVRKELPVVGITES